MSGNDTAVAGTAGRQPPLVLIASVARNGTIGRGNELVWDEPADKRWFRQQTLGCPVVMGRKTWDSLPPRFRPLPGRPNVVVTRQVGWSADGAQVAHSLAAALLMARVTQPAQVFVIGGAQLYAEAVPLADRLLLTEIDAELPGDAFFPAWHRDDFSEVRRESGRSEGPAGTAYAFVTYERTRPHPR